MRPLIICIGNDLRRDDGIGCEIARHLAGFSSTGWDVREAKDDSLALMEAWKGRDAVIIVDAMQATGTPGGILRLDPTSGPLNLLMNDMSSHGLGLGHSLELARSLAKLPEHCIVFVVEGANFTLGTGLSREVEKAIPLAVEQITQEAEKFIPGQTVKGSDQQGDQDA